MAKACHLSIWRCAGFLNQRVETHDLKLVFNYSVNSTRCQLFVGLSKYKFSKVLQIWLDQGRIMTPVKPALAPVIRPGASALPVTLTESPTDSTTVTLQVPTSPCPDDVSHDWHRMWSLRMILRWPLSIPAPACTDIKYVPFRVGVKMPEVKHKF